MKSMLNKTRLLLTTFLNCIFVSSTKARSHSAFLHDKFHKITSQNNFIILNGEEAQRFRLLGFLPSLHTFDKQIILVCITLTLATLTIACLFFIANKSETPSLFPLEGQILNYLPEPAARLLFYFQLEASAFGSVLLQDIMSIIHTPVGIGLNLASKLRGPQSSEYSSDDSYANEISSKRINSQGRRRYKTPTSAINKASTSKQGEGQYYAGIWNTGNSCFLNSTLQSIASIDEIKRSLESVIEQAEEWDIPTPVTDALYDLIIQLNTASNNRHAILPRLLTDALSSLPQTKVGSFFYAHQQQDAHELLVLITSALDDEMNAVMAERKEVLRSYGLGLRAALVPVNRPLESHQSPLFNPFRALIAQRTACLDCGYVEAVRHYPTDELSLNVPARPGSVITIEACLAHWSKLEVVDWICFRCSLLRTINMLKDEASYLEHLVGQKASSNSPTEPSSPNGHQVSTLSKKKSGAKRRKAKEFREKTEILKDILIKGYSEDEVESMQTLQIHDIKLDRTFSRASTKQVMLARTPKVLVLHLNRSVYSASNFGASKNNAMVLFDDELDLTDFVTGGDLNINGDVPISRGATPSIGETSNGGMWTLHGRKGRTQVINGVMEPNALEKDKDGYIMNGNGDQQQFSFKKTRYRLCGIVVHYGNHSSGHYVSYRRRKTTSSNSVSNGIPSINGNGISHDQDIDALTDGFASSFSQPRSAKIHDQWYRISDDSVRKCTLEDVKTQNPFLMFYERLGDDANRLAANSKMIENGRKVETSTHTINGHHVNGNQKNDQNELALNGSMKSSSLTRSQSDYRIPQGFEALAQIQENAIHGKQIRPRVFHRWESMPAYNGSIKKEEAEFD